MTIFAAEKLKTSVMKENESQKVAFSEKFGYSLGDAAANLVFQMMMIFLSVCSMCWLSITRVFMTRERWLSMLPSRMSC